MKEMIKSYLIITFGSIIIAFGVYFFEFANNFSTGGVSGISIILSNFINISPSQLVFLLNTFLIILGFLVLGKGFGIKTVYSSFMLSVSLWILEKFVGTISPFTNQLMLELFFDILLVSLGSALIFNEEASSGGTDIIAMILKKYTKINIGKALLVVDFIIVCVSFSVFGVEIGMYSLFGIVLRALVVDNSIESLNTSKCFIIITNKHNEIIEYITNTLNRGATVLNSCYGAYTNDKKTFIITVASKKESVQLKHKIKKIDKDAFTVITSTSDIIGEGFKSGD